MMVPLNSWPRVRGRVAPVVGCWAFFGGQRMGPPWYSWMSVPQMPQKATFRRTEVGGQSLEDG